MSVPTAAKKYVCPKTFLFVVLLQCSDGKCRDRSPTRRATHDTIVVNNLLYLLRNDDSCDLHVLCDGHVFPMHKIVVLPQSRGLRKNYMGQRMAAKVLSLTTTLRSPLLTSL